MNVIRIDELTYYLNLKFCLFTLYTLFPVIGNYSSYTKHIPASCEHLLARQYMCVNKTPVI